MKLFVNPTILVLLFFNLSCKDTENKNLDEHPKVISKQLIVEFNFKTNKPDIFKISMQNIEVDKLQKKSIEIFENVVPSTGYDAITAKFDPDNLSRDVMINLGNDAEKSVELKSILISYGENIINLSTPADFKKHLVFNKFIERDTLSNKFKTKRVDGRLNPIIRIKRNTINLLDKE